MGKLNFTTFRHELKVSIFNLKRFYIIQKLSWDLIIFFPNKITIKIKRFKTYNKLNDNIFYQVILSFLNKIISPLVLGKFWNTFHLQHVSISLALEKILTHTLYGYSHFNSKAIFLRLLILFIVFFIQNTIVRCLKCFYLGILRICQLCLCQDVSDQNVLLCFLAERNSQWLA